MTQWYDGSRDETISKLYEMRDKFLEREKGYKEQIKNLEEVKARTMAHIAHLEKFIRELREIMSRPYDQR